MKLPLGSIFYTTYKKNSKLKTLGEKVFCSMEQFFFRNTKLRNGMVSTQKINEGF